MHSSAENGIKTRGATMIVHTTILTYNIFKMCQNKFVNPPTDYDAGNIKIICEQKSSSTEMPANDAEQQA